MNKSLKLSTWSLYVLIVTTLTLSIAILAKIWFPEVMDDEIFLKIILTYVILIASSAIISKISGYIKKMDEDIDE